MSTRRSADAKATQPAASSSASSSSLITNENASVAIAIILTSWPGPSALTKSQIKRRRRKAAAPLRAADQLFVDAQRLIRGVLSFAEAEVHRYDPAETAEFRGRMQELTAANAELRSIPTFPLADRISRRAAKRAQIEELEQWLKSHGGHPACVLRFVESARAVAEQQCADINAIWALGRLCLHLRDFAGASSPLPANQQAVFRGWLLRVDALFTRLCSAVPHMWLSQQQTQLLLIAALDAGALQLVSVLPRGGNEFDLSSWMTQSDPFFSYLCFDADAHVVCHQPYLRLFEYGLDPTQIKAGGEPLPALQLARNFVRDHPLPAVHAPDPMAAMQSALDETTGLEPSAIPSVLAAYATHHHEPLGFAQTRRRNALHARFMHALIPAWHSDSTKVRSLLLEAAPGRLIPPLVDVVSRYLDLEGVLPEPVIVAVEDDAE